MYGLLNAQVVPVTAIVDNRSVDVEHTAKILSMKLNSALTDAGAHGESERGLYLVGELVPTGEDMVDTGMKKIIIRTYNLSLRMEQPMLDMQFGSLIIPLEGSGVNDTKAAVDAIKKFNPASSTTQNFIVETMQKANDYFVDNIDNIIDKAYVLAKNDDYDAGMALLWGCPNFSSIHSKVYAAMDHLYVQKQNKECTNLMVNARTAYSLKKYEEAMSYINEIDVESNCAREAEKLAKTIGQEIRQAEIDEQRRKDLELERQFQSAENERERKYELSKRRISAIENIASTFLQSKYAKFNYHIL